MKIINAFFHVPGVSAVIHRAGWSVAMFLFSLLLSACGGDSGGTSQVTDGTTGDVAPDRVSIQPELDTDSAVSQMITQTGGVLTVILGDVLVWPYRYQAISCTGR